MATSHKNRGGDRVETRKLHVRKITDKVALRTKMYQNNPYNEPVGILTGRCHMCGSRALWANNSPIAMGCNDCGFTYSKDRTS